MNCIGPDGADESSGQPEPPDPDVLEIDPTRRYVRYKDILGKGAFKTVYKAFDEVDGIEVAWNQVRIDDVLQSPEELERLYTEVHLLKSLKHENIVKFYSSWIDDHNKTVNIITELFTSGSLRQYRKKHKKVDMKAVKGWARQILLGLKYLHSHSPPIIHRDLKCDNVFINGNHGEVKIGDLGLATVMQQANARSVIGTPEFMAPELYDEDYNELVDVYSFGMCLLEMVTFEYPYSECKNSAQIYRKVSSGIKPGALSKVKDPEVKLFIEKCLVPAAQRLSVKELLSDPFLQVDGLNGKSHPLHLPDIVMPKTGAFGDRCVLSEEPTSACKMISMDIDTIDDEPPIVTVIENSGCGGSHLPSLEVQRSKKDNEFKLKGERNDDNSVSLILRIADQNGRVRNIHFLFYLDSDTAVSVAGEMVEQLDLADQNVTFIAELIDLLLINLISNWKPCVPIDQLAYLSGGQMMKGCQLRDNGKSSVGSVQNILEAVDISSPPPRLDSGSGEGSIQPKSEEEMVYAKLDEIMSHVDFESHNMYASDDQGSEASFVSAVSTEGNVKNSSLTCMCSEPGGCTDYNVYEMNREVRETLSRVDIGRCLGQKDICLNVGSGLPTFSGFPSNGSSSVLADEDSDEELRFELEMIELQYQKAIDDISNKRQQAIMAAKKRSAAQKKLSSVH